MRSATALHCSSLIMRFRLTTGLAGLLPVASVDGLGVPLDRIDCALYGDELTLERVFLGRTRPNELRRSPTRKTARNTARRHRDRSRIWRQDHNPINRRAGLARPPLAAEPARRVDPQCARSLPAARAGHTHHATDGPSEPPRARDPLRHCRIRPNEPALSPPVPVLASRVGQEQADSPSMSSLELLACLAPFLVRVRMPLRLSLLSCHTRPSHVPRSASFRHHTLKPSRSIPRRNGESSSPRCRHSLLGCVRNGRQRLGRKHSGRRRDVGAPCGARRRRWPRRGWPLGTGPPGRRGDAKAPQRIMGHMMATGPLRPAALFGARARPVPQTRAGDPVWAATSTQTLPEPSRRCGVHRGIRPLGIRINVCIYSHLQRHSC